MHHIFILKNNKYIRGLNIEDYIINVGDKIELESGLYLVEDKILAQSKFDNKAFYVKLIVKEID